ncbi:MAG: glycosyltransferase family 2 protein [Planctomycetota bacterium]|nr:glycosyltransferase family 2 protein [Planctomycetota bacterium]
MRLSVIVPAYNEEENVAPLVAEVAAMFESLGGDAELIIINDGSTDSTRARVEELMPGRPWLRLINMRRNSGQSAAFHAGIRAAAGELIAMLDADLQNDPADLPKMIDLLESEGADWVQGNRAQRHDANSRVRIFSTWVGRSFRRRLLRDSIRDTGCSLRVFRREIGLQLPLQFRGMHRFMPVYARRLGWRVIEADVSHRPRAAGQSKYGMWNRALPGLRDLFAVRWMFARIRPVEFDESPRPASAGAEIHMRPPAARAANV